MPEEIRTDFVDARMADGTALLNSAPLMTFLADISRKTNPAATVVPDSLNPSTTVSDEITKIETMMSDEPDKYWEDGKVQARYRELLDARDQMGS